MISSLNLLLNLWYTCHSVFCLIGHEKGFSSNNSVSIYSLMTWQYVLCTVYTLTNYARLLFTSNIFGCDSQLPTTYSLDSVFSYNCKWASLISAMCMYVFSYLSACFSWIIRVRFLRHLFRIPSRLHIACLLAVSFQLLLFTDLSVSMVRWAPSELETAGSDVVKRLP